MVGIKLTTDTVERAACAPGQKDRLIFDRELPGFGLRVTASGTKTFLAQYAAAGTKRRVVIGQFGVLTPEQARRRAKAILGEVAAGHDPFAEAKAKQAEAKAAEAAARAKAAETAYTVRLLIEGWRDAREDNRRPTYLKNATGTLTKHLGPWLDRPAASISTAEAVLLLDHVKATGGPIAANRVLAYGRAAFNWARRRQAIGANPFAGVEAPAREKSRDRVLSAEEIGLIWQATEKLDPPYRQFVRVLLLTMQRREEVAGMRWAELDDPEAPTTWTLPADRAKNGKAHVVHLGAAVRAELLSVPRIDGSPYVFASGSAQRTSLSAFSAAKRRLDAEIAADRAARGIEPAALPGWVMHDFRRSGVTALADMGFAPHVCDKILNHVSGTIRGVVAVYQRAAFLPERKAALEAWAAFVIAAAEGKPAADNVVPLHAAG